MERHALPKGSRFTVRHPVVAFLALFAMASATFHAASAYTAGDWSLWGNSILWYRASSFFNDMLLVSGAYILARMRLGPRWWRWKHYAAWGGFIAVCAGGAVFLLILTRRMAVLYEAEPPMATGWLPVVYRTLLPFLLLLWVRRRAMDSSSPQASPPNR